MRGKQNNFGTYIGDYKFTPQAKNFIELSGCINPDKEKNIKYRTYFKIYKEIYKNLKDNFIELNKLVKS